MYTKINSRGFTLVETLVYAAGLVLLVGTIVYMLASTYRWYDQATTGPRVDQIGVMLTDRIMRDVHSAEKVSDSSVFNVASSTLIIVSRYQNATTTKQYSLDDYRIRYVEGTNPGEFITPPDLYVSKFMMNKIENDISKGVRLEMDLTYNFRGASTTKKFSSVAVTRNSY